MEDTSSLFIAGWLYLDGCGWLAVPGCLPVPEND